MTGAVANIVADGGAERTAVGLLLLRLWILRREHLGWDPIGGRPSRSCCYFGMYEE